MADNTKIEWADATWQPITGCQVVSPGCTNCYAMRIAAGRLKHHPSRQGLTVDTKAGPVWTGEVRFNEDWLDDPLRWTKPRQVFVCAHGDLFAENVPDEWIDRVFAVMALAPHHTFLVLTKRAERMRKYVVSRAEFAHRENIRWIGNVQIEKRSHYGGAIRWPLPNVYLGVSVEDQRRADERIPLLLDTPAAKRFISAEPLLGPIDLTRLPLLDTKPGWEDCRRDALGRALSGCPFHGDAQSGSMRIEIPYAAGLDWVIVGGESGPGARPMHPAWARSLRDQCQGAGVPFFFKQWGEWVDWREGGASSWRNRSRFDRRGFSVGKFLGELSGGQYDGKVFETKSTETGDMYVRVGKKAAGRLLDGRTWDEVPAMKAIDCANCAARNNGFLADYCFHEAFHTRYPGDGRPIPNYPLSPLWCPGWIAEEPDPDA